MERIKSGEAMDGEIIMEKAELIRKLEDIGRISR